jgi:nucleoside-diphosphate-sugar epimerase
MADERFLVTGALGCIGAWVVRNLIREGIPTAIFDLASDPRRLRLIMSEEELARVQVLTGDIADLAAFEGALQVTDATHVIHLAALQVPFCKSDPSLGARVNVVGTVNVFEAAKHRGLQRVVYASSAAVYGISEDYPEGPLGHDAPLRPQTHYGVYKQANEGTARVYWKDNGISSIGLRPYVVYGPGRDQGLTSSPTTAMLAATLGQPYQIPFGGRFDMQFADDVAQTFIRAARIPFDGAEVFNLRGSVVHMREIIAAIEAAAPAMHGQFNFSDVKLGFPEEMDDTPLLSVLGPLPRTPLDQGITATMNVFQQAIADGRLAPRLP